MSGATDAAFRRQALKFGAPAVVSEMVAGEMLLSGRRDVLRRAERHAGEGLWIVQLAGRRPEDMRESARMLAGEGVNVVDINMGCPSRQVTGGASGSALMRTPDLARAMIDATKEGAGDTPVTLKMRLGWDDDRLNAPDLARHAERAGLDMVTVHGRTRCQFYKGEADWGAIADTVAATALQVIANGDICSAEDAKTALAASGAHGVMIGRAAMGRPWLVAEIDAALRGERFRRPDFAARVESLCEQVEDSLSLYGGALGLRIVRKHVAASVDAEDALGTEEERRALRRRLCRLDSPADLLDGLRTLEPALIGTAA
jgi:nifR3 family TIM-barrel protein